VAILSNNEQRGWNSESKTEEEKLNFDSCPIFLHKEGKKFVKK
jgi:hypothetical protein